MCDALHYLLDNIFIRFGSKLYRQIVGIPMGNNCAPLVEDLFLFCYERDFMLSLTDNNQTDIIEAFNSTSRYLDDLLNIDYPYFEQQLIRISKYFLPTTSCVKTKGESVRGTNLHHVLLDCLQVHIRIRN